MNTIRSSTITLLVVIVTGFMMVVTQQIADAAGDFDTCNNVISVPGNSKNVDDSDCEICANGGQEWYPCDEPGMCYCADNGGTVPKAYWGPFTPCTKAIAVPGNSKNVQDAACLACSNNGRAFYPCNQPGVLCMCAAGHGYMYNVDTPTTIPPTTQDPSSPTTNPSPTTTTTTTTATTTPSTTTTSPPSGGTSANYLIHATFEARQVGFYTKSMTVTDFGVAAPWENGMSEKRLSILTEGSGKTSNKFLRVSYPKGGVGPSKGGGQFMLKFANDNEEYREMYVSYRVRFRPGFNFVKGGKLPGLCGGNCNTGGSKPNGKDGWSARMMWRSKGSAVQYVYYPEQPSKYAEDMYWNYGGNQRTFTEAGSNLGDGKWHTVQTRVLLNNIGAGVRDGRIQSWFDGKQALNRGDMRIRFTGRLAIDTLYFSTFFGGSGSQWAPTANEYADFDDIIVSTKPILDGVNSAIFSRPILSSMEPMAAPVDVNFVLNGAHFGPLVNSVANQQTLKTALATDMATALFDDVTQANRIIITNVTVGSLYVESHINPLPLQTSSLPSSSSPEVAAEVMIAGLDSGCCLSVGEVQRRMTQLFNGTEPPVEEGEGGDFDPTGGDNTTTNSTDNSSGGGTDVTPPTTTPTTSWLNSTLSFYISANDEAGNTNVSITDVSLKSEPSVMSAPTSPQPPPIDDGGLASQTIYIIVAASAGCVAVLALVGVLIWKHRKSSSSSARRMGDKMEHLGDDDGSNPNFFDLNSNHHHHHGDHNTAYVLETIQHQQPGAERPTTDQGPSTIVQKESVGGGEDFADAI